MKIFPVVLGLMLISLPLASDAQPQDERNQPNSTQNAEPSQAETETELEAFKKAKHPPTQSGGKVTQPAQKTPGEKVENYKKGQKDDPESPGK